jgi:hypothetical protein
LVNLGLVKVFCITFRCSFHSPARRAAVRPRRYRAHDVGMCAPSGRRWLARPVRGGLCTGPSGALPDGHRDTMHIDRSKVLRTSRSLIHSPGCALLRSACKFPSPLRGILGLCWPSLVSPVARLGLSDDGMMMERGHSAGNLPKGSNISAIPGTTDFSCQAVLLTNPSLYVTK